MSYHSVQVTVPKSDVDDVLERAERKGVTVSGISAIKGPARTVTFLVAPDAQQPLLDELQKACNKLDDWQIAVVPVDAVVMKSGKQTDGDDAQSREELLEEISRGARLNPTYFALVFVSAIVAGLGMIANNVAAIIGAMVIAPLLGPVLASILGVSLGDRKLIEKAAIASASGIALAIATGAVMGLALSPDLGQEELARRGAVGFEDVALALAAGIAAALSITSGVSSALVGVMVAVALLPPAAAIGIFAGNGHLPLTMGAALLLAVNLSALFLSGQIVFFVRGIKPRTWYMRKKAEQSFKVSLLAWSVLMFVLLALIWFEIKA